MHSYVLNSSIPTPLPVAGVAPTNHHQHKILPHLLTEDDFTCHYTSPANQSEWFSTLFPSSLHSSLHSLSIVQFSCSFTTSSLILLSAPFSLNWSHYGHFTHITSLALNMAMTSPHSSLLWASNERTTLNCQNNPSNSVSQTPKTSTYLALDILSSLTTTHLASHAVIYSVQLVHQALALTILQAFPTSWHHTIIPVIPTNLHRAQCTTWTLHAPTH